MVGALATQGQAAGQAGAKRPMTFADLMAMKRVSDPQISPSGKWVMFSVTDVSLEKNTKVNHLWVVPMAGGKEQQITVGTGESNGRFSPDGKFVSFTEAPTETDSLSRIALAPWDDATGKSGTARMLKGVNGDADGAEWSPDSQKLLFVSSVYPECSDKASWADENACDKEKDDAAAKSQVKAQVWDHLLYRHWNRYVRARSGRHVLVVPNFGVPPGDAQVRDLTPASAIGDAWRRRLFRWRGRLGMRWARRTRKEVAYVVNLDKVPAASTNNDVFTLKLDEPGARAIKVSTSAGSDDGPAYSPDGKYLAFRSQVKAGYESDKFRLMVMDRGTKAIRELMPKFDRWIDEYVWALSIRFRLHLLCRW